MPKPKEVETLRSDGTQWVNARGDRVILKGCNLGNWLLLEMWMLDWEDIPDQYELENILAGRFGQDGKNRLMEAYRENWITWRDFPLIRSFGFNVVRVPFNYRLLEDDAKPFELKPDAFKWLDRAVDWSRRAGLYVILDLHGAPGGQSKDHTTGRSGQNLLWTDPQCQERTIWLWQQIAEHFRDSPVVAAYDVVNEPYGCPRGELMVKLFDEIYQAIRTVDQDHVVIAPATHEGIEFYGKPRDRGWENVAFTEHCYPGLFGEELSKESHSRFISRHVPWRQHVLDGMQAPFLVGEFNVVFESVGGPALMRQYYDLYGRLGWAATMWCYKLVKKEGGMKEDSWAMVVNADARPPIHPRTSKGEELEAYFRWLGTMDYSVHSNLGAALTSPQPPMEPVPVYPAMPVAPPASDTLRNWAFTDINGAIPGGQRALSESEDALEVYGGGEDIWEKQDQFRFVWRKVSGDFELTATVQSLAEADQYAKAGLMIRSTLEPDSTHFLINVFPNGEVAIGWRDRNGAMMKQKGIGHPGFPVMLAVRRQGEIITAAYSTDGKHWEKNRFRASRDLGRECFTGLLVLSHDNHCLTTAKFTDIKLEQ